MYNTLNYNCRLNLTRGGYGTSNDVNNSYRIPYYFSYEKKERGRIPNVEINKPFAASDTFSTTYNTTFIKRSEERDLTNVFKKFENFFNEYPKVAKTVNKATKTEYREEYQPKLLAKNSPAFSVEQSTYFPIIITGKDEIEPVPLTNNISKYLDIYVTTARQDYRQYSEQEQKSIASKDIVTTHETMEIPKGKGFGMKDPALPGQDLEKRDRMMVDAALSKKEIKLRRVHKPLPMVPQYNINTEYGSSYKEPTGFAKRHAFDSFVEHPGKTSVSILQAISPPGMYSTEYDSINKHTTPQTIV